MAVTFIPTAGGVVAEPVRVRRLTDQEGRKLQQIVRGGSTNSVRYRRAMMLLASAGGNRHGLRRSGLPVRETRNLRGLRSLLVGELRVQREGAAGLFCPLPRRSGAVSCLLRRVPVPPWPQEGADNAPFFNARASVGLNPLQAVSCPRSGSRGKRGPA